jgi:SAM-dependent methyltransferase
VVHDAARGFDAAAALYARSRPDYPEEAIDLVARLIHLAPGRTVLDVGAGTGAFSRILAARGARVVAVEPSAAMLRLAGGVPAIHRVRGVAEALPLRGRSVDAAVAAGAFHWFEGRGALGELHRALGRHGRLALVWNHRDDAVEWIARLSAVVERQAGTAPRYQGGAWRTAFDAGRDLFRPVEEAHFHHRHALPPGGVLERVAAVSFVAALPAAAREAVLDEVRALLASHPDTAGKDEVTLAYRTDVSCWERVG